MQEVVCPECCDRLAVRRGLEAQRWRVGLGLEGGLHGAGIEGEALDEADGERRGRGEAPQRQRARQQSARLVLFIATPSRSVSRASPRERTNMSSRARWAPTMRGKV